ncbi:hypothetical protein IB286_07780 [Spongiibacter sp. KMU-158]|uniref:Cytochrome c domain-containing protein n=1 Tax=Spongiibacter pelagi TaxID=2760804 RepID=A0A927C3F1_9GAMM|nr:hypothetical protein [Spongiibacter pelagi]MBD2858911.1 hypothetical protein [Spongiibacter pelagi]
MTRKTLAVLFSGLLLITGCGGGSSNSGSVTLDSNPGSNTGENTGGGGELTLEQFFVKSVEPQMDFCRTCHQSGGVADQDEGDGLMLSANGLDDFTRLHTAWSTLGGGASTNPILLEASDPAEPHSGGKPWSKNSTAYQSMLSLLSCWETPASCSFSTSEPSITEEFPLLGSSHARHVYESFCEGKPDSTLLPVDPRSTVIPGRNDGKAIYFNAWFEECQADLPLKEQNAKTCGEHRQRRDRGYLAFVDTLADQGLSITDSESYNTTWQKWGLEERPANFDQLFTLRYGMNEAPYDNPYPLSGEDPNQNNGGSGQLPQGYRQLKDEQGNWTGQIGSVACFQCHGGQIESENGPLITRESFGLGNANMDYIQLGADNSPLQALGIPLYTGNISVEVLLNLGVKQRGQNNAVGAFELLAFLLDQDSLGVSPNPLKSLASVGPDLDHPTAQAQDTPAWWNYSHRSRKFFDAGQSVDATRIVMAAGPLGMATFSDNVTYRHVVEEYDQDASAYILSTVSPEYPGEIDENLAKQGAILFHTKDLWAEGGNADAPKPDGGNGSCASCHGAYSPRYVNDPNYLEDPSLEGIAAHISPLAVIGTDSARADNLSPYLREIFGSSFWGAPEGSDRYVAPEDKDPITEALDDMFTADMRPEGACGWEQGVIGYLAPPLYGTWATAPYFHNGSVPTIEAVLDSSKRSPIWQRQLRTEGVVTGFDQRWETAYDQQALGWKSIGLSCEDLPGQSFNNCNPIEENGPSMFQLVENIAKSNVNWLAVLSIDDPSPETINKRLIYDTRVLGNSNSGHTFTDVLTEQERKAIIEYLKTL